MLPPDRDSLIGLAVQGPNRGRIVAILFFPVSWSETRHSTLIIWMLACVAVSLIRFAVYVSYRRMQNGFEFRKWSLRFSLGTFFQACVWRVGWWLFLNKNSDHAYTILAGMWMVGLTAASISAYTTDLVALLAFFQPPLLPGIMRIFTIGGTLELAAGFGLISYMGVVQTAIRPVHLSMMSSIRLNFENAHEIRRRCTYHAFRTTAAQDLMGRADNDPSNSWRIDSATSHICQTTSFSPLGG